MGGADCICSDKTGTLTQNEMTLFKMFNESIVPHASLPCLACLTLPF